MLWWCTENFNFESQFLGMSIPEFISSKKYKIWGIFKKGKFTKKTLNISNSDINIALMKGKERKLCTLHIACGYSRGGYAVVHQRLCTKSRSLDRTLQK